MNQFQFSDKLNADPHLSADVVNHYAKLKVSSMTPEEKDEWILNTIIDDMARQDGDSLVDVFEKEFPGRLQSEYNVCII